MTYLPKTKKHVQVQSLRHRIRSIPLLLIAALAGLVVGIILAIVINDRFFTEENTITIPRAEVHVVEVAYAAEPQPTPEPMKTALVTAYSCGGLKTETEIKMNCPSLKKYPNGRTSTGTTPRPYITVACDRANTGRKFYLDGIGEVVCEDTGGAIKGAGRFDLYVTDVKEAREFGRQEVQYREVE